jgi:hypothetical protein
MRPENCSTDGKWQDFSGSVLPCMNDATRSQPFTYDGMCPSNCDRFGPVADGGNELERFRTAVTAETAERSG